MTDWLNRCHFGDCREVMKVWPSAASDACIVDPPYGDTSLDWDRRCEGWMAEVSRVLKPSASIWVFGSMRYLASVFSEMEASGFRYAQDIVWRKQNGTGFQNDRFRRVHEHAVHFYRGAWAELYKCPQFTDDATAKTVRRKTRPTHTGNIDAGHYVSEDGGPRLQRSVIEVANDHGRAVHPTQKPVGILLPLLSYSCPPRGTVIDPFFGSGSTGLAAEMLGMQWAGCEIRPECADIQALRFSQPSLDLEVAA